MKRAIHNRRNFLTLSGLFGVGLLGLSSELPKVQLDAGSYSPETGLDKLKWWLGKFFGHAGEAKPNENVVDLISKCGKDCALRGNLMQKLAEMRSEAKDQGNLEEMVAILKKNQFGDAISLNGRTIGISYNKCYCSIRTEGYIASPDFCHCSKGWVKTVYEAYLQKPVDVKMISAIGRGDSVCHFEITA